ncbi:unnamed protein product, partial [marine sediment metagenome]
QVIGQLSLPGARVSMVDQSHVTPVIKLLEGYGAFARMLEISAINNTSPKMTKTKYFIVTPN